jgi:hypothetical protein
MMTLDRLRPTVAAAACGMAQRALDEALAHAVERRQFGQRLADFQLVKEKLARMATELAAARLLTYRAAWEKDRGAERITLEAAMAKAYATEAAQRIIDDAVQVLGGRGVLADHPVDRLYRRCARSGSTRAPRRSSTWSSPAPSSRRRSGMRVACIGGGPAGLYLAIQMKRADPSHEVVVHERNRADDPFGFGVVFSDATGDNLAAADPETTGDGRALPPLGRHPHPLPRPFPHVHGPRLQRPVPGALLEILARRARSWAWTSGSAARWRTSPPWPTADLVVAADGINSGIRAARGAHFRPTLDVRPNRFVWLGTTRPFPAFTFYFKEDEHGLWRVHAYQYEGGQSTFIVEATEETWRRTGLGEDDEDATIAFCEALFADGAGRPPAAANRSVWRGSSRCATSAGATTATGAPRAAGRRGPHRPLLHRLRHQAGHGGRHRPRDGAGADAAGRGASPPTRRSAGRRGEHAARRAGQHAVVRGDGALHGHGAASSSPSTC